MNRQVPETNSLKPIAIIGGGKVARHMIHYFESVGQTCVQWCRPTAAAAKHHHKMTDLSKLAQFKTKLNKLNRQHVAPSWSAVIDAVEVVLLLIPDDQIIPFLAHHPELQDKTCVHFSGSLYTEKAMGCHPLMTFGGDLYELEQYKSMPFVVDAGVDFSGLFPLLPNPVYAIKASDKVKYHALCVMAGNFSQMLWQTISQEMESLDLPTDLMSLYLQQNTQNFIHNPAESSTGPFVRGDVKTIEKHLATLNNHPLGALYQAFYDWHQAPKETTQRSQL